MHKIDGAGNLNGNFVNEDAAINRPPTEVTADWMNAVQEELANVIIQAGSALNKPDNTQLIQAINQLVLTQNNSPAYRGVINTSVPLNLTVANVNHLIVFNGQASNTIQNLPEAASYSTGAILGFKNQDLTNAVRVSANTIFGDNIDGSHPNIMVKAGETLVLAKGEVDANPQSPNHNWLIMGGTATFGAAIVATSDVGKIDFFPANLPVRAGYLKANGASYNPLMYPELHAELQDISTNGEFGNPSDGYWLPDLRGKFIRSWSDNGAIDAGRMLGSTQLDELKSHDHSYTHTDNGAHQIDGLDAASLYYQMQVAATTGATGGTETRPVNIALVAYIKYI